jgi:hypothetical protein
MTALTAASYFGKACQFGCSNQDKFPDTRSPANPRCVAVSTRSIKP